MCFKKEPGRRGVKDQFGSGKGNCKAAPTSESVRDHRDRFYQSGRSGENADIAERIPKTVVTRSDPGNACGCDGTAVGGSDKEKSQKTII